MNERKFTFTVIICLIFICAVIASLLLMPVLTYYSKTLSVPEKTTSGADFAAENSSLSRLEITPDNVQAVLAALEVPQAYSFDAVTTLYSGDDYIEKRVSVSVAGDVLSERAYGLPSYTDLIALDKSCILSAELLTYGGSDLIIRVAARSGFFGYVTTYDVSVTSGLLVSAETKDGDTTIYRMEITEYRAG